MTSPMLPRAQSNPFTVTKVNRTTFVIREDDAYKEHPLIYAKLHPILPVMILSDTGCDELSEGHKKGDHTYLRDFLEHCPLPINNNAPLNPHGKRQYIIIITHCHYDHIGGIGQFLEGGTTEIIASAAGRDFVETDLESHSLFKWLNRPVPYYNVTKWAQAFERLMWPFDPEFDDNHRVDGKSAKKDLGVTIIPTPGHTPDELAWYDHGETHLYVGDSFYREGEDEMPIFWPGEGGNLIEWAFSVEKLHFFIRSENARAAAVVACGQDEEEEVGWVSVPKRVLVSCAHTTVAVGGDEIMAELEKFWGEVLRQEVDVIRSYHVRGEWYDLYRGKGFNIGIQAPRRLMDDARLFFYGADNLQHQEVK